MENVILVILLVFLFIVPFAYIFIVDIIEISKRFNEVFRENVKPVLVSIVNTFTN